MSDDWIDDPDLSFADKLAHFATLSPVESSASTSAVPSNWTITYDPALVSTTWDAAREAAAGDPRLALRRRYETALLEVLQVLGPEPCDCGDHAEHAIEVAEVLSIVRRALGLNPSE